MGRSRTCSIVIPIYNSEDSLQELVEDLALVLPDLCAEYEVLLINDGSLDRSWDIISQLSELYPWVFGIKLMRNYGQHNALLCGIRAAQYEIIVTMDDDLQHPPKEIVKLLDKLDEGYDVVYGSPKKMPHGILRNLFSLYTKRVLSYVMGIKTVRGIGSFRAFRTELRKAFAAYQSPTVIIDALLSWGTKNIAVVYVDQEPRHVGKSNYSFSRLFQIALQILTGFSTAPLRLASLIGFSFTIFGLGVLVYVITISVVEGSVPGFPFLASIIALFGGMQLFALGIFGEYLARIFNRSLDQPPYVIEIETDQKSEIEPD
jgi:undecaprenyl-phosphate 4-deoxy-4-formamido-L-arabinose transferase